jgi:hypothetical protein
MEHEAATEVTEVWSLLLPQLHAEQVQVWTSQGAGTRQTQISMSLHGGGTVESWYVLSAQALKLSAGVLRWHIGSDSVAGWLAAANAGAKAAVCGFG